MAVREQVCERGRGEVCQPGEKLNWCSQDPRGHEVKVKVAGGMSLVPESL